MSHRNPKAKYKHLLLLTMLLNLISCSSYSSSDVYIYSKKKSENSYFLNNKKTTVVDGIQKLKKEIKVLSKKITNPESFKHSFDLYKSHLDIQLSIIHAQLVVIGNSVRKEQNIHIKLPKINVQEIAKEIMALKDEILKLKQENGTKKLDAITNETVNKLASSLFALEKLANVQENSLITISAPYIAALLTFLSTLLAAYLTLKQKFEREERNTFLRQKDSIKMLNLELTERWSGNIYKYLNELLASDPFIPQNELYPLDKLRRIKFEPHDFVFIEQIVHLSDNYTHLSVDVLKDCLQVHYGLHDLADNIIILREYCNEQWKEIMHEHNGLSPCYENIKDKKRVQANWKAIRQELDNVNTLVLILNTKVECLMSEK